MIREPAAKYTPYRIYPKCLSRRYKDRCARPESGCAKAVTNTEKPDSK